MLYTASSSRPSYGIGRRESASAITFCFPGMNFKSYSNADSTIAHRCNLCAASVGIADLGPRMRDQFVCGLISQSIQKKLLTKNHTFKEATDIAIASEAATANMKSMSHDGDKPINHVTSNSRKSTKTYQALKLTRTQKCDRCGMNNHTRDTCKYKNATCFKCNKQGHLKSECRQSSKSTKQYKPKSIKQVEAPDYDEGNDDFVDTMFCVGIKQDNSVPPITVQMRVDDIDIDFEVDTGAAVSIISFDDYESKLSHLPLKSVKRTLHAYTGTKLDIAGEIKVTVNYRGQSNVLPLIVVRTQRRNSPPLLGRTWLEVIKLDWKSLFPPSLAQNSVEIDNDVSHSNGSSQKFSERN
ncbi:uncharacterized protein [Antedon mediterranea]|uniref:uncharacterized protein n=1 Tax=Antedon mediterranea TaxID=105859 RepID=UPI003AF58500